MNSKERMIRALEHEEPDRVPLAGIAFYDWSTPFLEEILLPHFGFRKTEASGSQSQSDQVETVLRALGTDFRRVNVDPPTEFMKRATFDARFHRGWGVKTSPGTLVDEWGITRVLNSTKTASRVIAHPLKGVDDLGDYVFPDPNAEGRYDSAEMDVKRHGQEYATSSGCGVEYLFDQSWFLRGFNEIMRDFYANPTFVEKLYDHMQKYYLGVAKRLTELGVTIVGVGDDIGMQNTMIISPAIWRRFIKPRLRELVETIKKGDAYVYYHSDGAIQPIIPDLVEIGVDILNPVQPECIDPEEIKKRYGDKLTLSGTLSLQKTLSGGTPEDVKNEVIHRIRTCGPCGGLMISPSNNTTVDVPIGNFLTIHETVKKYGKYPIAG